MDSPAAHSASTAGTLSSPEILSPGGKSRYGRTRRPKVSHDFYNIDDVVIDENPAPRHSPLKSPKLKPPPKSPIIPMEVVFEVKNEFTKLDDLGMKVANNFKSNLQRGLDDSIKERKFFKSMSEKVDVPNVVDVTKVLKMISSKPAAVVPDMCEAKNTPKAVLKTYSNRRKHVHDSESFIVESFGLPDEPIIPVGSPIKMERDTKIDIDVNCEIDVNLVNPWGFGEFDPVPLYASEPIMTLEEICFNRGGMLDMCSYDTNFEKSRIPTPVKEEKIKKEIKAWSVKEVKIKREMCEEFLNMDTSKKVWSSVEVEQEIREPVAKKDNNKNDYKKCDQIKSRVVKENMNFVIEREVVPVAEKEKPKKREVVAAAEKEKPKKREVVAAAEKEKSKKSEVVVAAAEKNVTKVLDNKLSLVKKKRKIEESPSRILRSSTDNNNVEAKKDTSSSSSLSPDSTSTKNTTAKTKFQFSTLQKLKTKNQLVNPVKLSEDICSPQIRVILNPLSCMHKYMENKKLVPNPVKIKRERSKLRKIKRRKMKFRSCKTILKIANSISEALPGIRKKDLKKHTPIKFTKDNEKAEIKEEVEVKSIKTEFVDFQPGDLAWAKIGSHPYWPCMVTQEPVTGDHKKFVVNRYHPLYHVRFFGDKGRRSWVKAQHVMLFYGGNDLEALAKVLKAEDKVKVSFIKESYEIRPTKLSKWRSGVEEAVSLKCQPVQERLNYFFEVFASKREKEERLKELGIKQECLEECEKSELEVEESPIKSKKRGRMSEGDGTSKKVRKESQEIKVESEVEEEMPEENVQSKGEKNCIVEIPKVKKSIERSEKSSKKEEGVESQGKESPRKKKSFSSENLSDLSSPEGRKKIIKKSSNESLEISCSTEGRKAKTEEKGTQESPKKMQKKSHSIGEVEIFTSPEGRKRITRKSRLEQETSPGSGKRNEDTTFKAPLSKKVEIKTSLAEESDDKNSREPSQSPEKRKKGKKASPEEQATDDNLPLSLRLRQFKDTSIEETQKTPRSNISKKEDVNETNQTLERKRSQQNEDLGDSLKARKKLRSYQSKPESVENVQEPQKDTPELPRKDAQETKIAKRNSTEEEEPKLLKNKRHLVLGDVSNSDTDSKFSDNSSVPASLESQAVLFRRNNIFRGIPKEKVCQVCEEGGEVFKCKGPCNGVYHYKCAMKDMKENEEKKKNDEEGAEKVEAEGGSEEREKNNVQIVSVDSKKPLPSLSDSPNFKGMSLAEKIDFRMKEIMKKFDYQSVYAESTDSSSEEFVVDESFEKFKNQSKLSLTVTNKPSKKEIPIIKHVTADNISYICVTNEKPKEKDLTEVIKENFQNSKCYWCTTEETSDCLVCHNEESKTGSKFRQKCSIHQCGKYYHPECLKTWPQTQWSLIQSTKDTKSDATYDTFVCPRHVCHTCISDDPRASNSRCSSDKVVKCLRCPATYHSSNYCVPAGSHILSSSQIVCPRHYSKIKQKKRMPQTINANWCFICSKGGDLICCETCPTSVHAECLPGDLNEDDTFFCEDCQSGRLPLYDEIVWVKLGSFRWWPALILFPNEVPDNLKNIAHNRGEFVVKFYGTYDHYWVGRGRTFLFQEGDKGHSNSTKKRVDSAFVKAIEEAAVAHQLKKQFKLIKVAEKNSGLKPPPYIRIKVNKPVGNVRLFDGNTSNTTSCECDPNQPHPCGPDSDCLNRLLLTECNPEVCPAGERCNNQCFEKREYPPLIPHRTQVRGWGLKTLAPIRKGQFVIEYVGEIIDEQEYQRRIQKMHEQKEENYYFLTIDKDRTLDAGPKGNVARFMNHSCQPNCETQKWTVNGDTRVGLFAKCDLPADTELTFNYNLECIGKEKKMCKCGAPNCSGFIGVKVKLDGPKKSVKPRKKKTPPPEVVDNDNPCFICGKVGDVGACNNKICTKYYHLACVGVKTWPEGGKWICQWHNCNFCSKRTIRCCVKCVNSYCPPHSQGTIRYDKELGFVCYEHDPKNEATTSQISEVPKSSAGVSTEKENVETKTPEENAKVDDVDDDLDSMSLSMRLNGCVTSTPLKKSKEESSHESTASSKTEVKSKSKRKTRKSKRKSTVNANVKNHVKNTANLFNPKQSENEDKLREVAVVKNLRNGGSSLNRTDPDKNLPIRKRNRLRCGNTL